MFVSPVRVVCMCVCVGVDEGSAGRGGEGGAKKGDGLISLRQRSNKTLLLFICKA